MWRTQNAKKEVRGITARKHDNVGGRELIDALGRDRSYAVRRGKHHSWSWLEGLSYWIIPAELSPPGTSGVGPGDGYIEYSNIPGINKPSYHIRIPPHTAVRYSQLYSEHNQHPPCSVYGIAWPFTHEEGQATWKTFWQHINKKTKPNESNNVKWTTTAVLLITSISSPLPRNTAITNNNKILPLSKVRTYTVSLKFIPHLPKQPFFKCFHIYVNVRIIRLSHQILPIRTSY